MMLLRDLRGIVTAAGKIAFPKVFEWLYPEYFPIFQKAAAAFYDNPLVMTSLLKFFSEFSYNKAGRISFDVSSVNGILIFKEVSKAIIEYGIFNSIFNLICYLSCY